MVQVNHMPTSTLDLFINDLALFTDTEKKSVSDHNIMKLTTY